MFKEFLKGLFLKRAIKKLPSAGILPFAVILIIILAFLLVTANLKGRKLSARNQSLTNELGQKPKELTVYKDRIKIEYVDAKPIVLYRAPDGYVKFDLLKYDNALEENYRLSLRKVTLEGQISRLKAEVKSAVTPDAVEELEQKISSLTKELEDTVSDASAIETTALEFFSIKNFGLTFRPYLGVVYQDDLRAVLGVKVLFWKQYSLGIGSTKDAFGIGVSRYVSDMIPFLENTQIYLMPGKRYDNGNFAIYGGLVVNL